MNSLSKWIWHETEFEKDVYCEFFDTFMSKGNKVSIKLSVDTTYGLYINGKFVDLGQYADFPQYKIYDEIDITEYCVEGENKLAILVWYLRNTGDASHYCDKASLRYEVYDNNEIVAFSSEKTLSRISKAYVNGFCRNLSCHMAYSYFYDFTKEDNWINGELIDFSDSIIVEQDLPMFPRPIAKMELGKEPLIAKPLSIEGHKVFDLGGEQTGYLTFSIDSPVEQDILIAFSEHIDYGFVKYLLNCERNFSFEFKLKKGKNVFFNPIVRLGLRYLEVIAKEDVDIEYIGIISSVYKLDKKKFELDNPLDQQIYDVAVRTLELCMHEHYEDCPYREQALYALDSRNQMLCGYYAFGEYKFPRSCLTLMGKDVRDDGLLTITVPSRDSLSITSFSLFYIIESFEYIEYSKDISVLEEIKDKLNEIINRFIGMLENNLLPVLQGKTLWNFYEWTDGMSGNLWHADDYKIDTALNCIFVLALKALHRINEKIGFEDNYLEIAQSVNKATFERFYDEEQGLFINSTADSNKSELVNSLAILCGAITGDKAVELAEKIADPNNDMTKVSISMIGFKYDSLIKVCGDKYNDMILDEIREKYKYMLDRGATTFWETHDADRQDVTSAYSRCHGWSAMPVYYYHRFNNCDDDIVKYYD